jgi:NodT family efflux transporter outer membrane factor (OMF) lipoprotein
MLTYPYLLSRIGWITATGCLATLSGCFTTDVHERLSRTVVTAPSCWQQGASSTAPLDIGNLSHWWECFNDPVLSDLIARALRSSPDIVSARAKIDEFRARRGLERAALLPSASADFSGQRGTTHIRGTDATFSQESYSASVDVSWQADMFGVQTQNLIAASADVARTQENFYGTQVSLAADVAVTYVALRTAEGQLRALQGSLEAQDETVRLTQSREQSGLGNRRETQQATSELNQAEADEPVLLQTIAQSKNQLTLLRGQIPGSLDALLKSANSTPVASGQIALGIPADTLRQRPDVRAAERAVAAAAARRSSAERERLPSLALTGSIGVEALTSGHIFSPENMVTHALGQLAAPLFDAGKLNRNIAVQDALENQALAAYQSTVLRALAEVENALIAVQRNGDHLSNLDRAVRAAQETTTLAMQQYEAGQIDLLIVLDAQRTSLSLAEKRAGAVGDQATAYIQLYKALGGGWSAL